MPELPEVETMMRGLTPIMKGQTIKHVEQNRPNLRFPFPENLPKHLKDQKVIELSRRAKYILVHLENEHSLIIHLGMSGNFRTYNPDENYVSQKHDHLVFELKNGSTLAFNDPRRFGMVLYTKTAQINKHKAIHSLGVEPLGEELTPEYLYERFKRQKETY